MRAAVAVWNGRVSPVFDVAGAVLLADVDGGRVSPGETRPMRAASPRARAAELGAMEVEVLICGAISRPLEAVVRGAGIDVVPWIAGDVNAVLEAYAGGSLSAPRFLMPGCCGRRRRFRGGFGGRGAGRRP